MFSKLSLIITIINIMLFGFIGTIIYTQGKNVSELGSMEMKINDTFNSFNINSNLIIEKRDLDFKVDKAINKSYIKLEKVKNKDFSPIEDEINNKIFKIENKEIQEMVELIQDDMNINQNNSILDTNLIQNEIKDHKDEVENNLNLLDEINSNDLIQEKKGR